MIAELERAHEFFNRRFFGDVLPRPTVITIERSSRFVYCGSYIHRGWMIGKNRVDHIAITTAAIREGMYIVMGTLLHEMVHQWNATIGLPDTSERQYHNVHFRDAAGLAGLVCKYSRSHGYSATELTGRAQRAISRLRPDRRLFPK